MSKYDYISIVILLALSTSVFSQATREETMNKPVGINTPTTGGECEWCKRTVAVYAQSYTEPEFTHAYAARWLAGIFDDDCVTIKAYGEEPKPEYVLSVRYEHDFNGYFKKIDFDTYHAPQRLEGGKIRQSVMSIVLFCTQGDATPHTYPHRGFNTGVIEVQDFSYYTDEDWSAESDGMSLDLIIQAITPQLRSSRPLKNRMWNYEQTPAYCSVTLQKEVVQPEEETEILIKNFKERRGRTPEYNITNYIMVRADKGEILNTDCTEMAYDPRIKIWAFDPSLKDGLAVKYKAPDKECTEEIIHVYNTCNIVKVEPAELSPIRDEIATKKFKTKCTSPWSGTVMYERNISWKDKQPTEYGYVEYTRQLTESATLNLTFGYTHTYTDTEASEEYYDNLIRAQGTYNCTIINTELMVDEKDGSWNKIEERATGSGNLEEVGGFMTLNYDTGKYTLNLDFTSPEITGKTVITSDEGVIGEDTFTYMFNGYGTEFEEKMKENQITGSWSLPAGKNQVVTGATGNVPGAKFNWSFGR
jgi:hypothetical protein